MAYKEQIIEHLTSIKDQSPAFIELINMVDEDKNWEVLLQIFCDIRQLNYRMQNLLAQKQTEERKKHGI